MQMPKIQKFRFDISVVISIPFDIDQETLLV